MALGGSAQELPADMAASIGTLSGAQRTRWGRQWRKLISNRNLNIGVAILLLLGAAALLAPWLTPYQPLVQDHNHALLSPSLSHPFGTDNYGRDVLTRVLFGARIDLRVGFIAVVAPFIIGIILGSLSGYYGRWVDTLAMRAVDIVQAFPFIVLVIAIVAVLGPGLTNMYIAVALVAWVVYARLIRSAILVEKTKDYVTAAKAIGGNDWRVMRRHLFPNVITPCIVYAMADIALYIGLVAALSFLGLGERPPAPEWGAMITSGRDYMTTAWWISALPGLAIIITGTALSLVGDGLADILRPGTR
jgi:peptide/nickel transport system permease protein